MTKQLKPSGSDSKAEVILTSGGGIGHLPKRIILKGFGEPTFEGRNLFHLMPEEVVYLLENRSVVAKVKDREVDFEQAMKFYSKKDRDFYIRYLVYRDLRKRGYIPKEGTKFGADFRVYERGTRVLESGEKRFLQHAPYLVKVLRANEKIKMSELVEASRIANSVNKRLILAVVDREGDIVYLLVGRYIL